VAICGAANYLAALELLLPADVATTVAGDRGDVVALLLAGLTTEPAALALEP
jgi:hypothetical protein